MDTGEGKFEMMKDLALETEKDLRKKYPKAKDIFTIGEKLKIKGSNFQVKDISPWGIKLKLLK